MKQFAALLILLPLVLFSQSAPARSYYVAPTGSDGNNGSLAHPWKSVGHALLSTGPGDTVLLREGTYNERIEMRGDADNPHHHAMGGSAAAPWTLQSYPGETATISGGLSAYSIQYTTIQKLNFIGAGLSIGTADWLTPSGARSSRIQIRNNTFRGPQARYGFVEAAFDDSLIEGNTIVSTGGGDTTDHGIYVHHGDGNAVRANTITGVSGYGIHVYDERKHTADKPTTFTNLIIEGNSLSGSRKRSGLIVSQGDDTAVDGVIVRNNVIYGNAEFGIDLTNYGAGDMRNLQIYGNTIAGNARGGIGIGKNSIAGSEVRNNIIVVPPLTPHIDKSASGSIGLALSNNVYWPSPSRLSGLVDPKPVVGDPLFVNPPSGDFHLQPNSAAIGHGAYR